MPDARLAAVSDPYRRSGRVPALPQDYTSYSIADDSSAMIVTRKPPFDVCPLLVSKNVVAIYCEGPTFTFIFVSMYAPPHSPLENVLEELTNVLSLSRSPHVIVAGDFNSKHRLWGQVESDEHGLLLAQIALAQRLLPLNDAESLPTYETPYTASWIDLTLAKPSVVSTAFRWTVHDDTTYSEHRLVEVRIGLPPEPGRGELAMPNENCCVHFRGTAGSVGLRARPWGPRMP
ncbi:hypothetical protein HPB52_015471 [Rhipicephalus sanguineus]|uniref:Endonuclease/exonuclease/phosphatase domain-containing protein n=1 Tax=Rhipicephalus sanguineus TaxID=34632 RepID=A0A9D4Q3C2_RHISA|nr:hypothetical protein HPB52_015471 [Rhipicephalus sanguineus]